MKSTNHLNVLNTSNNSYWCLVGNGWEWVAGIIIDSYGINGPKQVISSSSFRGSSSNWASRSGSVPKRFPGTIQCVVPWQGQSLVGYGSLMFIAGRIFMVFSWDMDGYFAGDNQLDEETLDAELSPFGGWSFPLPFCDAHTTEDRADHGIQYIYIIIY